MTIEHMRHFIVVANMRSLSKAANALFLSKSTLQRSVQSLEEHFGCRLFDRQAGYMILTQEGNVLYRRALSILNAVDHLENEMDVLAHGGKRFFSINTMDFEHKPTNDALREYRERAKDVKMLIEQDRDSFIKSNVRTGAYDLGIAFLRGVVDSSADFHYLPLFSGKYVILISERHPLAERSVLSQADLVGQTEIILNRRNYNYVPSLGPHCGVPYITEDTYQVDSLESMIVQVRSGAGFALLPDCVATEHGRFCRVIETDIDVPPYEVVLFWQRDLVNADALQFIEFMRQRMGS